MLRIAVGFIVILGFAVGAPILFGAESLGLPPLFTDNMVLQSKVIIKVKVVNAPRGAEIEANIAGKSFYGKTQTGADSVVEIGPLNPGGPYELAIGVKGQAATLKLKNVLVGEVWVCSGQSNMEWTVNASANADQVKAQSGNSKIRLFAVPRKTSNQPDSSLMGKWVECNSDSVGGFSAVGYHFGRKLNADTGLPVGLINASWGGTYAEAWTREEDLMESPTMELVITNQKQNLPGAIAKYKKDLENHKKLSQEAKSAGKKTPKAPQNPEVGPNRPAVLFNGMISPLLHFPIKGSIWYQGEANAGQAHTYRTLFPILIESWRKAWGQPDLPFYFVQLAPYMAIKTEPQESNWAELREAQLLTKLRVPNTGMAVITDLGEERDIHPKKKAEVGERLALLALKNQYQKSVQASGPQFKSVIIDGNKAILEFSEVGSGLECKGEALTGFTIAGPDRKFVNATARIDGNKVVVQAESVSQPVAVRFGWANFPVVNLWNKDGLPASPFRTDEFKGLTGPR
jgi:sialate O-acetylesterase